MAQHARPHLSTHNRNQGHSAVAGAAYRLGLRLYDERQGKWHDFSKRVVGEEIVRALTVAPPGAPAWAMDPAQLWNRVESAEKRKDSQVARDYRVPIPRGLSDDQAADLAERVARFISDRLTTPVSIGLHRDNRRDALGELKAEDEIGYHAHLYFPTRKINCASESESPDDSLGFSEKMSLLTNRTTSSQVVEMLNEEWARLSNQTLEAAGLPADRDHRSYERLGIDRKPQPKLGQAAVAMERRGFFTRKGDAVRDIVMPAKVAELEYADQLTAQQRRAHTDLVRDAVRLAKRPDELALARQRGVKPDGAVADRFAYVLPGSASIPYDRAIKLLAQARQIQRTLYLTKGVAARLDEALRDHALAYSVLHENG
jgi:ATP-dependent exoDNAse (exonuclease V) alpha subunit